MAPSLQSLLDQIEDQRSAILNSIRSLSTSQLNHSPGEGQWSMAQVLSHITSAERLSVSYIQKKALGIDTAHQSGLWEELKIQALIASQRLPGLKFKAPRRVVENTAQLTDLASVETSWNQIRNDLRAVLEKIPPHQVNRLLYKHPVAGYLNVRHALIFFREHVIHHQPQLNRLRKQTPSV